MKFIQSDNLIICRVASISRVRYWGTGDGLLLMITRISSLGSTELKRVRKCVGSGFDSYLSSMVRLHANYLL